MSSSTAAIRRNFPYFRQQLSAALQNSTTVVKFICITVFLCYFLTFSPDIVHAISVTPGYFIPPSFWIWTAFTHCFFETHFWQVAVDIVCVGLCGKLIEPLWGAMEMLTFFAIVNVSVALLSTAYYLFIYMCTFNPDILFHVQMHGLAGYLAGVAVTVKQIMPDHVLIQGPLGKMRNRNVPLNVLLLSLILWAVGLLEGTYSCMYTSGLITSWVYLRFFQVHSNGSRGDMADGFNFASFFPNVLQPPIAVVCNTLYEFLVKVKLCSRQVKKREVSGNPSSITISLPGTDPHDAERRRQIALKALNDRLNKPDQTQWPLLVDDEPPSPTETSKTHAATSTTSVAASSTTTGSSTIATTISPSSSSSTQQQQQQQHTIVDLTTKMT